MAQTEQTILKLKKTPHYAWVIKDLLTPDQCNYYRQEIDSRARNDNYYQQIIKIPKITNQLWTIIKDILPEVITYNGRRYERSFISDHVTVSRHRGQNIGIHKDSDVKLEINGQRVSGMRCFHKLTIYLNDLSDSENNDDRRGGTSFYDEYKKHVYTVKPCEGAGLLFDMRDYHSGAKVDRRQTKYMIGCRPIYKRVD
jgi:hypothetical protein